MFKCVVASWMFSFWTCTQSANILGFFPTASVSHQVAFQPIWRELSLRGHKVTVYTPCPLKDSSLVNLTEVDLSELFEFMKGESFQKLMYQTSSPFKGFVNIFEDILLPIGKVLLELPNVQELLQDNVSQYDVALVEPFPATVLALGHKFRCPVIEILSLNAYDVIQESMGNPVHPVLYPDIWAHYAGNLSFFERVYSSFQSLKMMLYHEFIVVPKFTQLAKEYFGKDTPPVGDLMRNVSVLLTIGNPVFNVRRPLVPTTVELEYMHIKPKKALPKDLKMFLDEAKQGVIYMSLGSNVRSASLPESTIKIFIEMFSELPYKVIWKWENESLAGVPRNVLLKKWLPQQDILGHRNIKLFITQGGFQSTEETIFNGVPTVALPFFADQIFNAKRMEFLGMGRYVDPFKIDKTQLRKAVLEIIHNSKYREKVREMSRLSLDRNSTGLEKAVWWVEYVIRNKGTKHLRSPYLDVPAYQYYMLDVLGFVALLLYFPYLIFRSLNKYQKGVFVAFSVLFISYLIYE